MLFFDFLIRQTPGCHASHARTDVTTATYGRHRTRMQTGAAYVFNPHNRNEIDSTQGIQRTKLLLQITQIGRAHV